jgi:hypothetical protein
MSSTEGATPDDDGPAGAPAFDVTVANQARMYDYLLGGKDHYAVDREAAEQAQKVWPEMAFTARANRAFLGRAVRYLTAEAGIRQFLDIGTGIPTAGNLHQVAQAIAPESRVVYVDYDPVVLAHARALLNSSAQGVSDYLDADLRDPGTILAGAARTLDFSRPVAVMLVAIMHLIVDDDDPYGLVGTLMAAVPPGSYLALSQVASDIQAEQMTEAARRYNRLARETQRHRTHDEVARFFDGLDMLDPGLVPVQQWRPGSPAEARARSAMWGGVARKG